jgi:hypothetical protein
VIISFAWTTEVVKKRKKTVTRRDWSEVYFQRWVKAWREGRWVHDAYDRSPRIGGDKFGEIKLDCEPYREKLKDMPLEDLAKEGGYWASKAEFIELFGGNPEKAVVVVRFHLLRTVVPVTRQMVLPGLAMAAENRVEDGDRGYRPWGDITGPSRTPIVKM